MFYYFKCTIIALCAIVLVAIILQNNEYLYTSQQQHSIERKSTTQHEHDPHDSISAVSSSSSKSNKVVKATSSSRKALILYTKLAIGSIHAYPQQQLQTTATNYASSTDHQYCYKYCKTSSSTTKCYKCCDDTSISRCHILKPKGICHRVKKRINHQSTIDSDNINKNQYYTKENPEEQLLLQQQKKLSTTTSTIRYSNRYTYHEHPQCHLFDLNCFDLHRCRTTRNENLRIYVNTTSTMKRKDELDLIVKLQQGNTTTQFEIVTEYRSACLILVFPSTYKSFEELYASQHWQYGSRNTVLYNLSRFPYRPKTTADAPMPTSWHVGYAAIASDSITRPFVRPQYDMVLPLPRQWARRGTVASIHRPRQYLLSFRGSIVTGKRTNNYHYHRYLAIEYWDTDDDDIYIDVTCTKPHHPFAPSTTTKPYNTPSTSTEYDKVMWESTFGYAPGGSGVSSYRLGEILSTGGIPVVVGSIVLPMEPEVTTWSECVIRISEQQIIDLPRILRNISEEEIHARQNECWNLLQDLWGDVTTTNDDSLWISDSYVTFTKVLRTWELRIQNAISMSNGAS